MTPRLGREEDQEKKEDEGGELPQEARKRQYNGGYSFREKLTIVRECEGPYR